MKERQTLVKFIGLLKYDTIEVLLNKANAELDKLGTNYRLKKKIYRVMVECLENILKHALKIESSKSNYLSKFTFETDGDEYYLTTGNPVFNKDVESLKIKIDKVNELDLIGLKEMHDEVISKGTISNKGGAGLGIIDIAIKSQNELKYSFEPLNKEISYFWLEVKITP